MIIVLWQWLQCYDSVMSGDDNDNSVTTVMTIWWQYYDNVASGDDSDYSVMTVMTIWWQCCDNVASGDDSDNDVMTLLNDEEQVIVRVEAAVSDVNKLSAALNTDGVGSCNNVQTTSCQLYFVGFTTVKSDP